jgi:hypothetical protein
MLEYFTTRARAIKPDTATSCVKNQRFIHHFFRTPPRMVNKSDLRRTTRRVVSQEIATVCVERLPPAGRD